MVRAFEYENFVIVNQWEYRVFILQCATIGPADYNYDETISTLRYASRAKNIRNKAHINEDPKDALLRQFQKEIEALKKQLEESSKHRYKYLMFFIIFLL